MNNKGNKGEKEGKRESMPAIRNDRDGIIIDMRIKGASLKKISNATGLSIKTIGNVVNKGGRLFKAIESLKKSKTEILQTDNLDMWTSLLSAKEPVITELKSLALESGNEAVRLKAIMEILSLTGIREADSCPPLDPARMVESIGKLSKWLTARLVKTYQEEAPQVIFKFPKEGQLKTERYLSQVDPKRLEKSVKMFDKLKEKIKPSGEMKKLPTKQEDLEDTEKNFQEGISTLSIGDSIEDGENN